MNRTGSWMKSVEWLCHLTNMTIEFLQSGMQYKTMSFLNAAWLSFIHLGQVKKQDAFVIRCLNNDV